MQDLTPKVQTSSHLGRTGYRLLKLSRTLACFAVLAVAGCSGSKEPNGNEADGLVPRESLLIWRSSAEGDVKHERAELKFHLDNHGKISVKVLDIVSGCGCLKPEITKSSIPPGGSLEVVARATPPPIGKKDVQLVVSTDSPTTPKIPLTVRLIARRVPPFVYGVFGDIQFRGEYSPTLSRDLSLMSYEPVDRHYEVTIKTDLDFVRVESLGETDEDEVADPELIAGAGTPAVIRRHRFRFSLKEPPPQNSFLGEVTIDHPFDPALRFTRPIVGDLVGSGHRLLAIPNRLRFKLTEDHPLRVTLVSPLPTGPVEVETPEDGCLVVEQKSLPEPSKSHPLVVKLGGRVKEHRGDAVLKFKAGDAVTDVRVSFDE